MDNHIYQQSLFQDGTISFQHEAEKIEDVKKLMNEKNSSLFIDGSMFSSENFKKDRVHLDKQNQKMFE